MMLFSQAAGATMMRRRCQTSAGRALTAALTLLVLTDVTRSLPQSSAAQTGTPEQQPLPLTTIAADPSQSPANTTSQQAVLSRLAALSGVTPPGLAPHSATPAPGAVQLPDPQKEPTPKPSDPDWYEWARLASTPMLCTVSTASPQDRVQACGVKCEDGSSVVLWNTAEQPAPFELKLHVPHGVFRIERLSFVPSHQPGTLKAEHTADTPANPALRRLEGLDTPLPTVVVKRGTLAPGEIAIIRTSDTAREARLAMMALEQSLKDLAQTAPGPAAKLKKIQKECDKYTDAITSGPESNRQKRLSCIHRLILLYSQAEAQHRNNQSREKVSGDPGARTMAAVERLEMALAETSAIFSGLVSQVELTPFTPVPGAATNTMEATVQVSLTNSGTHSVDKVKLGMDTRAFAQGSSCSPDDAAYFGELRPGQSVRAAFKVRFPLPEATGQQNLPSRCIGDVSYFANGAPAHLRPKGW